MSIKTIIKFAKQGKAHAQLYLGFAYLRGHGVPIDYVEAARWFRMAAEQGEGRAQYWLGRLYREGKNVGLNKSEALQWIEAAKKQGYDDEKRTTKRHKLYLSKPFDFECSIEELDKRGVELIARYGSWLNALAEGSIWPTTVEQEHFLSVHKGAKEPDGEIDQAWFEYRRQCLFEEVARAEARLGASSCTYTYKNIFHAYYTLAEMGHPKAERWLRDEGLAELNVSRRSVRLDKLGDWKMADDPNARVYLGGHTLENGGTYQDWSETFDNMEADDWEDYFSGPENDDL